MKQNVNSWWVKGVEEFPVLLLQLLCMFDIVKKEKLTPQIPNTSGKIVLKIDIP